MAKLFKLLCEHEFAIRIGRYSLMHCPNCGHVWSWPKRKHPTAPLKVLPAETEVQK